MSKWYFPCQVQLTFSRLQTSAISISCANEFISTAKRPTVIRRKKKGMQYPFKTCYSLFNKSRTETILELETSQLTHYTGTEKQITFHFSFCIFFQVN